MFNTITVVAIIQSVAAVALLLIALGLGLSVLTWWFWTTARPEPISLAPLEIMSDRRYTRATEDERKRMIDSARELVMSTKSPQLSRRTTARRSEHGTEPESGPDKPIDPLLK